MCEAMESLQKEASKKAIEKVAYNLVDDLNDERVAQATELSVERVGEIREAKKKGIVLF